MHPLLILLIGMVVILGAIIVLRMDAFLALIAAAILVSLLAPGDAATKITRVAEGFGRTAGSIGIVIALAAIIGAAMQASGAADRIVQSFLGLLGEQRGATALAASGFVLSIPVFYDTVFYLLVPLARAMHARTNRNYLKYLMAIAGGACATHTLVPPTPGPLAVAGAFGVDLGTMILVGMAVALPAAGAGLWFAGFVDARMPVTPASAAGGAATSARDEGAPMPGLVASFAPIVLPVLLISAHTIVQALRPAAGTDAEWWAALSPWTATLGNANLALFLSAGVALLVYLRRRRPTREQAADLVSGALMGAGIIILITAAGGAFGAMLQAAGIGPAIESFFGGYAGSGMVYLVLAFAVASLIKVAQGSSTVAMITTAGMLTPMVAGATLPFHAVYLATATAAGSLVGTWMNDSGFWVFSKLGGVSEVQTLKSWSLLSALVGVTAFLTTLLLAVLLPLR